MLRKETRGSASPAHLQATEQTRRRVRVRVSGSSGGGGGGGRGGLLPDAEGGGAVVDDDGGGVREAREVGLPRRAADRRHLAGRRREGCRRRRRGLGRKGFGNLGCVVLSASSRCAVEAERQKGHSRKTPSALA